LLLSLISNIYADDNKALVKGRVVDRSNGVLLNNCNILISPGDLGTTSDDLGRYSIKLPYGTYTVTFSYMGYKRRSEKITVSPQKPVKKLNAYMIPKAVKSKSVTYTEKPITETLVQKMGTEDIRRMPTTYPDVMRAVKILPGVSSNNELSSGYNVRGGNFDENLIYLNGYEIYRPFLLRQGVEENLSLANQEMVEDLEFHNGAFSAMYGDKMSSALEIRYKNSFENGWGGKAKCNLIYSGMELHNSGGKLSWTGGLRYANPKLFVNQQHTEGEYEPEFYDGQILANYQLTKNSTFELFFLSVNNTYILEPEEWIGHYGPYFDPQQVTIDYHGKREYTTTNTLAALKYKYQIAKRGMFDISYANYKMTEQEDMNIYAKFYDDGSAYFPGESRSYLKERIELADNRLELNTNELKSDFMYLIGKNTLRAGLRGRQVSLDDRIDENFVENGENSEAMAPHLLFSKQSADMNSFSAYVQDDFTISKKFSSNFGVRYLYYQYTDEHLISPRISFNYRPNVLNTFNFSYGYYYQPPFFYEIRNKEASVSKSLESQLAIHYILGWEHRLDTGLNLTMEAYYKKLDNLIPYYVERVKLEYGDSNNSEGYARGFDILLKGEIIERLNSWLGYSYLDTKEKVKGTDKYKRRVLDQTHTLRFFLQDSMPNLPHIQSHLRILFGSGYRYFTRYIATDEVTSEKSIDVNTNYTLKYPFYARFDVGFTLHKKLKNGIDIVLLGEVHNMFYHTNVASYSWVKTNDLYQFPTRIVNLYPGRFFNIGLEVSF